MPRWWRNNKTFQKEGKIVMTTIGIKKMNPGLEYAASELKNFLMRYTNSVIADEGNILFELRVDESMPSHCYGVHGDGKTQVFTGGSHSAVLCAVYEALAHAGILFEAHGFSLPGAFSLDALLTLNIDVQPKVRQRGIRQHINFTMDISSYPLKEAKEYIRDLARMRYNAITFHSYSGQWHSVEPSNPEKCPGHFFYGHTHMVPTDDELTASRIRNRKIYCIPEVEAVYEDPIARGEYAVYWLNEVMKTAREAYMTITLSVEPDAEGKENLAAMLRDVCRLYPDIDVLEIISYECGGNLPVPSLTLETAPAFFENMMGEKILSEDGKLEGLENEVPYSLHGAMVCLKRTLTSFACRDEWMPEGKNLQLRAGMYINCVPTLKVILPLMRKIVPADVTFSLLPAHGSLVAAENIEKLNFTEEDWQRFMLYSWAEFDGNMYLQQMSTDGLEKLTAMINSDSVYGMCLNHWRTAENNLCIDFFAETSIRPTTADSFYRAYAKKTGIGDENGFAAACARLAKVDIYAREKLMNIGFPFEPCWYQPGGVPLCNGFKDEHMQYGREEYLSIRDDFRALLDSARSEQGVAFLRLMENRCHASSIHIDALFAIREINEFYDYENPSEPTGEEIAKAMSEVERSMALAREYMHTYGEILPDRGSEGQVANYAATIPVFIRRVAGNFDKQKVEATVFFEAPPAPDTSVNDKDD